MSVLKQKRTTSKAEFINTANQIYVETLNFLTRLSARYSRLIAEPVAKLAGEIIDHAEKANSIGRCSSTGKSAVTGCGGSKVFKTLKATCFLVRQQGGERYWNSNGSPNPVPISPFGNGEKSAR